LDETSKEDYYVHDKEIIMDYIAVNELKRPRLVRERLAAAEEMILTSNGRPMAVIMYVDEEDDPEDVLTAAREARSQIALRRIRERARRTGAAKLSDADIDDVIAAARRERGQHS
jgi:antitoxin (DNA-binding transcriptional repressor) of toxin-antitoxin stability system